MIPSHSVDSAVSLPAPFHPMSATPAEDEFARIVAQHQRAVCAVAYSAVRDRAKSEEIAQEAFLVAWRKLPTLSEPPKLPAWICGIARNLAKNVRRGGTAREQASGDTLELHPDEGRGPLDALLEAESQALVERALGELDATYREPLVLFYRQDQSLRDVAAALEISEANAKQRVSRGRALLAERVAGIVERSLARSGPGTAFTALVVAAAATLPRTARADTGTGTWGATPWLVGAATALIVSGGVWLARLPSSTGVTSGAGATSAVAAPQPQPTTRTTTPGPHYRPRRAHEKTRTAPGVATPAQAEIPKGEPVELGDAIEHALEKPIDLELKEVKTTDVLRLLSEVSGVPIVVRGAIADEVSLSLRAVSVQEALDETLDRAEAVWREAEVVHVVSGSGPRGPALEGAAIDLHLARAPLGVVAQPFTELFDRPVVVPSDLAEVPIDLDAVGEPAGRVFARLVEGAGLRYELVAGIEVRPDDERESP